MYMLPGPRVFWLRLSLHHFPPPPQFFWRFAVLIYSVCSGFGYLGSILADWPPRIGGKWEFINIYIVISYYTLVNSPNTIPNTANPMCVIVSSVCRRGRHALMVHLRPRSKWWLTRRPRFYSPACSHVLGIQPQEASMMEGCKLSTK